jgi:DNA polymerase-3 subunit delta
MDSLSFLEKPPRTRPQPVYVLHGDEPFLKRHVQAALRTLVLGEEGDLGLSNYSGDRASFAVVLNDLTTLPFVGSRRLVVVETADPFVSAERLHLEKYVQQPSTVGVLVLEVNSWPANTKLARMVPESATIVCKAPQAKRLPDWCVHWSTATYGKQLAVPAARLLVDLVGADMGLLDQELAKLAAAVGEAGQIEARDVDRLVNNSRDANTWAIFELIGAGETAKALTLLDRLFTQGEDAMKLLGMFSYQLRMLAQVGRLYAQGINLDAAMTEANVHSFKRGQVEQQLRHLGRRRLDRLSDWLLETDLGLKGGSSLPPRTLLERLVVRLSRPSESGSRPTPQAGEQRDVVRP